MTDLCETLARGSQRYLAAAIYGPFFSSQQACTNPASEEELFTQLYGEEAEAIEGFCSPDAGSVFAAAADIARAEAAGRVRYHADRAGNCVATGRAALQTLGGLFGAYATPDGGQLPLPEVIPDCVNAVEGLQQEGEPCQRDIECAPDPAGVKCVARGGASCEGVCRRLRKPGEICESQGFPGCTGDNACLRPGNGTVTLCAPPAGPSEVCSVDGGTLECPTGYRCTSGRCLSRLGVGSGCDSDNDCLEDLSCEGEPRRCVATPTPAALGQPCGDSSSDGRGCTRCLTCFGENRDGGPFSCVTVATLGESCANAPCSAGYTCSNGTCITAAGHMQPCVRDDRVAAADDETLRGNCRFPSDSCSGTPALCRPRVARNQPCESPPVFDGVQGSCRADLVCKRSSLNATTGTCVGAPAVGEACGDRFDLYEGCAETAGTRTGCLRGEDAGVGVCVFNENVPRGERCSFTGMCAAGLFCQTGTDGGFCQPAASVGQICSTTGNRCVAPGACVYGGQDAGFQSVCITPRSAGNRCVFSDECATGLYCTEDAGVCGARRADGTACEDSSQCGEASTCNNGVCTRSACVPFIEATDSCADGGWVPTLLFFGTMVPVTRWRRRHRALNTRS